MSNWNKVNSEMYSLTDGPYHCIVRESGQMYYCEVFRNDDLILVSTVEGLQEAKSICEIEILADLKRRVPVRFRFDLAAQEMHDALRIAHRYSNPRPILFDFKDTGGKDDAINLPKGWYLSADGKDYKRKLGDYAAIVTPLSDDRIFLSVIQHNTGRFTCFVRFDGKAVFYGYTLEGTIKLANTRLESTYESDCSNDKKDCSGYFTSSEGGVGFLLGKHFETIDRCKKRVAETNAQAAKATTEQEPKYKWAMLIADYYHLSTDEFHVSVFTALDKWILKITERSSNTIVINSALDECEDAKKMAELFLKGYYDEPEVKLTHEEPKYKWKEVTSNNHSLKHGKFYAMAYSVLGGGWSALLKDEEDGTYVLNELTDTKQDAKELVEHFLKGYYEGLEAKEAHKAKNPEPFAVVEGWNIFVFRGRIPLSKKPTSWCFRAEKENSHATYYDFESENEAKAAALEWVRSCSYGCVDTEQPNPTEVEETVIAQIRKRRDVGREKYGTTMEREDLSFLEWLQHLQEELLDAAIYAEKLKREHRKELLSDMIVDDENSGLYD